MVQVTVTEGVLEGELVQNEYGGEFCSFKGIPYAQPPVGDLRFKAPQPPNAWEGVRAAKEFGPKCYQNDLFTNTGKTGSEDCLYLNVYTPDIKSEKPLPVMFWIHGGAFICGSGNDDIYGPEFLVRQGVVMVTINYRLEILGFLCLDTPEIPGNAGMKDQVQALRWVNKNIASFGGDPKNITIFGESAGGASISYLLISPMSKGLFKRAIAQSGSSLCDWARSVKPRDRSLALARQLGCNSEDPKELYEFFKNQPIEKLVEPPRAFQSAPQPPKPWEGVREAKEFDGGAFICGGGNDDLYGPEFLVRQGVVVVTINYRLEILGFLCLDTPEIPGNAAMKDQVQALRWVNKNIASFGGDPKNITIFGESAGGASISYLLISPMSKGLFKRAIAQSGSSLCDWARSVKPRERSLALARQLGCNSEDAKELYEFFKNQPIEKLVEASVPITLSEAQKGASDMYFSICDEKKFGDAERFFYGDSIDAVSNNVHEGVDIMTGFTTDEGLIGLASVEATNKALGAAINFTELFISKHLSFILPMYQQLELGAKIRKFYFGDQIKIPDDWEKWVNYLSMQIFILPTIQWVKLCAPKKKNKIYLYKFSCKSERNVTVHLRGLGELVGSKPVTSHADDLLYLFNAKMMNTKVDTSSDTFQLIDRVSKLWTNFAKHGNPTPDDSLGVKWAPYTVEKQDYLDIGNVLTPGVAPEKEEVEFWENILKEYDPQPPHLKEKSGIFSFLLN